MAKKFLDFRGERLEISYEIQDRGGAEWMLFLHGWGSGKKLMQQAFGESFLDFKHLYVDLPGFGQSYNASCVLDSVLYAEVLRLFLQSLGVWPSVILGHSFGGKLATLLAPKELILLSSAGIPYPKPLSVRAKIFLAKAAKTLGIPLRALRARDAEGLNEVMYETFKNVVDEDFSSIFSQSKSQAYIFWGMEDRATPLVCGQKMAALMEGSLFFPMEGDHYFFLRSDAEIERIFLESRRI